MNLKICVREGSNKINYQKAKWFHESVINQTEILIFPIKQHTAGRHGVDVAVWCMLLWVGNRSFVMKVKSKQTNNFAECHRLPAGCLSVGVKWVEGKTGVEMS